MPKNKTATTTSLAQRVDAASAAHAEAVIANRLTLETASTTLAEARAEVERAEERAQKIRSAITRGADDFDASDLSAATGEVEAAKLRLEGAESRINLARRKPLGAQLDAALGVVEAVKLMLPMVPIFVTAADRVEFHEDDAPAVVIRQTTDATRRDGTQLVTTTGFSGVSTTTRPVVVEIEYCRAPIHRVITKSDFETAARKLGLQSEAGMGRASQRLGEHHFIDSIRVNTAEPAPLPVVKELTADHEHLANHIGRLVAKGVPGWSYDSSSVITMTSTEHGGVRLTSVPGVTEVREPANPGPAAMSASALPTTHEFSGSMLHGLGRVLEADIVRRSLERIEWALRTTSRISHDVPHPPLDSAEARGVIVG